MPWFVKTEVFREPRDQLEYCLESHQGWIKELQLNGQPIISGFLVNDKKNPGGGLLLFYANSYSEADKLIRQDPLIVNDCVQWELHEWVGAINPKMYGMLLTRIKSD